MKASAPAKRRPREAKRLTPGRVIAESVLYPVNGILQSLFSVAARRERLCQASGGGSPRRCAKNALHCSQNPVEAVRGFGCYIEANQSFIPNHGDRYRHGEAISTAFAESAVNQVVSKRMVKKMFSGLQLEFCVKLLTWGGSVRRSAV